jgi:hypothetical protein
MNTSVGPRRVVLAVAVLGLLAAYSLVWPAYRSRLDIEIDVNEGWNAHFADAATAARGETASAAERKRAARTGWA